MPQQVVPNIAQRQAAEGHRQPPAAGITALQQCLERHAEEQWRRHQGDGHPHPDPASQEPDPEGDLGVEEPFALKPHAEEQRQRPMQLQLPE
jgi:hypothetical protein